MSLLLRSSTAPFDPGIGFPYPRFVDQPGRAALRCIALSESALSLVNTPDQMFNPGIAGTGQAFFPDFAYAARRPVNQGGPFQPPEQFGTAVRFNGTDNDGLLATNFPNATNFTITGFVYVPVAQAGTGGVTWMLEPPAQADFIDFEIMPNFNLAFSNTGSGDIVITTLTKNQWYFIGMVVTTAGNGTVYWKPVSSSTMNSQAITGITTFTPTIFTIASDSYVTEPFNGRITGMKMWNVPLSAGDIALEAGQILPFRTDNIVGAWQLVHAATKTVDSSGTGNTLTAKGAGTWVDEEGPFLVPGAFNPQVADLPWAQQSDLFRFPARNVSLLGGIVNPVTFTTVFDPSTGFPWEQSPDPMRLLPRALNVGGASQTLLDYGPIPSWLPDYPDFARATQRAINQGGIFQQLLDYGPLPTWLPDYPDFPRRAASVPVNTGGLFQTLLDYGPAPNWYPEFPDFIWAAKRPVNQGGSFHQLLDYGPLPTWFPDYPDLPGSSIFKKVPVITGGLTWVNLEYEPTDWFPDYPDIIWPIKRPVNEGGLFWATQTIAATTPQWYPDYPDIVLTSKKPVNVGGSFHQLLDYGPVPSWLPEFPDFAYSAKRPVNQGGSFQQLLDYGPLPTWLPDFPDFARGRLPIVNVGWFAFDNIDFVPKASWYPDYPDFAARATLRALNTGGISWTVLEYEPTDWFPDYPDFIWAAKRPVNQGGAYQQLLDYGPLPTWLPDYPDFARAALRPVNQGGNFQTLLDFGPTPNWLPDYPDFARSRQPNVNAGWFALVIQEHEPITDWLPDYPDFAGRALPKPVAVGDFEWIFVTPTTVSSLWYPDFPDFAYAAKRPVNTGGLFWTNLEYEPTDWFPDYPDFARGRGPALNTGGSFQELLDYGPAPKWYPDYPDFARGLMRPVNTGIVAFANFDYVPKLSWQPEYPDITRTKQSVRLAGGSVFVDIAPFIVPLLAWAPSYPDFIRPKASNTIATQVFGFEDFDYVPKLEWLPDYPDFVRAKQGSATSAQFLAFENFDYVPRLSWHPTYPDWVVPDPRWVGWFATSLFNKAPALDWLPDFPDYLRPKAGSLNTGGISQNPATFSNPVISIPRPVPISVQGLFFKTLELPLPNTLTRIYGIHQSDVIIASAIKVAMADMRANPWLLDYVFASLPQDPITWREYGEQSVQAAKEWFLKTNISVMVTPTLNELKVPAISISLIDSSEATNEATLGDIHSEPIEDNDMSWPALCAPFTPTSYVPATGVIVLPAAPVDFWLAPGMFIIDKQGNPHEILDVIDDVSFSIAAESVPDLRDCVFKSSRPNFKVSVESMSFRETYRIGVHAGGEVVYVSWLHSIVVFAMLRYKQALLEARGFERSSIGSTDLSRDSQFESENTYSRYMTITGYVRQYWPKNVSIKTDAVIPFEIKVSGQNADVKVGGDVDELLWIGDLDSLDPKKRH